MGTGNSEYDYVTKQLIVVIMKKNTITNSNLSPAQDLTPHTLGRGLLSFYLQRPLLLTWFNYNPSMDK